MPPTCFIFCGNFSSVPYGKTQIKSLKGKTHIDNILYCTSVFFMRGNKEINNFKILFIFLFLDSLKALADAICAYPNIHSRWDDLLWSVLNYSRFH